MKLKKIIVVLLILIYIISFCPISKANDEGIMPLSSEYEDNVAMRNCYWGDYDSLTDTYPYHYQVFTKNGLHKGVLKIPSEYYNLNNYFICVNDNDGVTLWKAKNQSTSSISCGIFAEVVNYQIVYRLYFSGTRYIYNFDTNKFDYDKEINNTYNDGLMYLFCPNNFIFVKGISFSYGHANVPLSIHQDFQTFECPELSYKPEGAFRLYLKDFHGSTITNETFEITNGLTELQFFVYDFKTKNYLTENLNLLSISDILQDDQDRYYLDINFSEVLPYLNTINGDYLIILNSAINSVKTINLHQNDSAKSYYDFKTKYNSLDYWRYQYYASSGSGILVPSDAEGSPLNPDNPDNPDNPEKPDQTAEAIKGLDSSINNQTQKIEEQTNAINNQTEKINEQTNAIKENNETNKNIFQKIIELPRFNYRWIFKYA